MRTEHKHKEAFCLMLYRTKDGEEELIWNSRDGATPFLTISKTGKEMMHVAWHKDQYLPHLVLKNGDRYFADMTKARATFLAKHRVANFWDNGMASIYDTIQEAIYLIFKNYYGDGHRPTLLEHGEDITTYINPGLLKVDFERDT